MINRPMFIVVGSAEDKHNLVVKIVPLLYACTLNDLETNRQRLMTSSYSFD